MPGPLVSVIIPVYNRENTVVETINSVLNQTYKDIEIIVVDDGSTDNSLNIVKQLNSEITIIHQVNTGVSSARNNGIKNSNGEIITFLDSDDVWLPDKISTQVSLLERAGDKVVCCLCNTIMEQVNGTEELTFDVAMLYPQLYEGIWLNVLNVIATRFILFNQAVAIRRTALNNIGLFDEDLWVMEDYDLALRLSILGPWCYTKEPLVIWKRGTENGLTVAAMRNPLKKYMNIKRIYENFLAKNCVDSYFTKQLLKYNLNKTKREIAREELITNNSFKGKIVGCFYKAYDKVLLGIFRRTPLYPKMIVAILPETGSNTN